MRLNNRGVALLQVLIISAVLAGLSAMILRATLSRTVSARQVRRTVSAQMIIESCMARVNALWAAKDPQTYADDLDSCRMDSSGTTTYTCTLYPFSPDDNTSYTVRADFSKDSSSRCQVTYTIEDGVTKL